jgi:hypothetical protein
MRTRRGSIVRLCFSGKRQERGEQFRGWLSCATYRVTHVTVSKIYVKGFYCPIRSWVLLTP